MSENMATYEITIPDNLVGADLEALATQLATTVNTLTEIHSRVKKLQEAEQLVAQAQRAYHEAADGGTPPEPPGRGDVDLTQWLPWRQPQGAHDAYPERWVVQHLGDLWESERNNNVWEPGTPDGGWKNVTPAPGEPLPETPDEVTSYVVWQPWMQYMDGTSGAVDENGELIGRDYVEFNRSIYGCVQSHKSQPDWTPDATPALWVFVAALPVDETPVEPEPDPEPEDPAVPWESGMSVVPGDIVVHEGSLWEAKIAHTTHSDWAPSAATHAVWLDLGPVTP